MIDGEMPRPRIALALAALAALAGCAGAEAMPGPQLTAAAAPVGPEAKLGLHPGESMAFEVQLAGVLVGEAQLAVGEPGIVDGRRALVVRSRAATAGAAALVRKIVDEATTVIDADSGQPISVDASVEMGDKRTTSTATFSGTTATVTYRRSAEAAPQTARIDFGANALHDAHSAMAQLRGWRAAPGTTRTVFVVGGRRLWRVDVKLAGEESIGSAVGNRRAVVYEGSSYRAKRDLTVESDRPTRTFRVWLSDDADRVPLKVTAKTELGDVIMTLTEYNRP
ncbi:MAG TPA: DUF3108 domain-containing protein [Kofleriaceae bacterium]|nr:DUF3108 domain-containing protein [Kofleriaceae bacterium]